MFHDSIVILHQCDLTFQQEELIIVYVLVLWQQLCVFQSASGLLLAVCLPLVVVADFVSFTKFSNFHPHRVKELLLSGTLIRVFLFCSVMQHLDVMDTCDEGYFASLCCRVKRMLSLYQDTSFPWCICKVLLNWTFVFHTSQQYQLG